MKEMDRKLIDAVVQKAEAACPGSLALIGLYGSAATGDTHEKSDLDLLILVNDEHGRQLAEAFILDDTGIGYDLYCIGWETLEGEADCPHAHLSRLLDAQLVYVQDQAAVRRFEGLKKKAADLLASDERYQRARTALESAKKWYAECCLTDSLSRVRTCAGAAAHFLMDAIMLYHGRYFKKGVKRTFEELEQLPIPFDLKEYVLDVIRAETAAEIRNRLTELMRTAQDRLPFPQREKAVPSQESLSGTYEEMVSNWRSKMTEAAEREDLFSSFMNMVSFQFMLHEIAEDTAVDDIEVMDGFDPRRLEENSAAFDRALDRYLEAYRKAGIQPKRFAYADDFLAYYKAKGNSSPADG